MRYILILCAIFLAATAIVCSAGNEVLGPINSFEVFDEQSYKVPIGYYPSGWMGDYAAVRGDYACPDKPYHGKFCQKWSYSGQAQQGANWAGVSFQYPEHNFGQYEGRDLTGYKKLTFWVKGENGGEVLNFRIGGNNDTLGVSVGPLILTNEWQQITMDLRGKDLTSVGTAFMWSATKKDNPDGCVFYLDDIRFEE